MKDTRFLNTSFRSESYSISVNAFVGSSFYVLGHEIGHNLGAYHNPEAKPNIKANPPYAVGQLLPGSHKRTIMRYQLGQGLTHSFWF